MLLCFQRNAYCQLYPETEVKTDVLHASIVWGCIAPIVRGWPPLICYLITAQFPSGALPGFKGT